MENLKIEYLPIESLKPYEKNARKHERYDIDAIAKSIERFGFNDPIGIWGDENLIVEGHGRLLAAKELGLSEVPCIRLDELTDEQRRAYAIVHNKTTELSEWDFDKLSEEINSISFSLADFGFWSLRDDEPDRKDDDVHPTQNASVQEIDDEFVVCPRCKEVFKKHEN